MNEEKLQKAIEEIIEVREERMKREEETFLEWKEINDNKYKVLWKYERLVDIILELKDIISDMPLSPVLHIKDVIEKAEKIIEER